MSENAALGYDSTTAGLIRRRSTLYDADSLWRTKIQKLAEVIRPSEADMLGGTQEGDTRTRKLFDSTAIYANQNFAAGMFGTACNPADDWLAFETADPDLNKWGPVKDYLGVCSRRTLASFGPSYSAFYAQCPALFLNIGAFGEAYQSSEVRPDQSGFLDVTRPLSECVFDVDENGDVNAFFRMWQLPIGGLMRFMKGRDATFSRDYQQKYEKDPFTPVDVLHALVPSEDYLPGRIGKNGFPFASVWIEPSNKHEIYRGGFDEFPIDVARWEVGAGQRHSRGLGEILFPDAASLNVMTRDNLKAGARAADPPLGAPSNGDISVIRTAPGKITYGAITPRGDQLVKPLMDAGTSPFSLEMANQLREAIKDGFFFSLMQLVGRSGMTATETLERNEERMRLMGPYIGRLQSDFLAPKAIRRYKQLRRLRGVLPPPPPEMAGKDMQVAFVSPAALAQKSARANRVLRAAQGIGLLAQVNPDALDRVNIDKAAQAVFEGFAVGDLLNDDDATDKARAVRRQTQMAQSAAELAPGLGDALHSVAKAGAVSSGGKAAA